MTNTPHQRSKFRKQEIIEHAADLLQTQGFENFSYRDLSERLGITKASIHYHFPKKEDLGVALCQWIQCWHEKQFAVARTCEGAWPKLCSYLKGAKAYAEGENKICPLSSLQVNITSLPASMRDALKQLDEHEIDFIADILQEGRDSGEMNFPGDAHSQATLFVLTCKGALQYTRVHGPELFERIIAQARLLLGNPP